jgi:ribosomal protein S18 acetylase RimI-like enzyme
VGGAPCRGGTLFGALDGQILAGVAIYRPALSPGTAELAVLHVSRPYRRRGIGRRLAEKVIEAARADGARRLYVSSSPTRGTVDFYRSLGFAPAAEPDPDRFRAEPDDIHMTLAL